jgi:VWFA-related protein
MPQRFIIFLFDDWHLDAGQLSQVRRAAAQVVGESLQETDAAAVISTSGQTNTGFTQDRTKLKDAIENLHLQSLYAHVYGCPDVSHYQANLIVNENDADALAEAIDDAAHCMGAASLRLGPLTPHLGAMETSVDAAAMVALAAARTELAMGEQGTRVTEGIIKQLIAKLGTMPGQHSLILISPGFFAGTLAARTEEERILDQAAQANVMISTLDARGLYTFMLDTSMRYISLDKEKYNKESLKTNDDVLAELAAGTGGTYFHNSNDLAGGFKKLAVAPECLYLLAFSPKNLKQDGSYHHLKVKVNLVGAKLQVRHGYFTEKAPKKKT